MLLIEYFENSCVLKNIHGPEQNKGKEHR